MQNIPIAARTGLSDPSSDAELASRAATGDAPAFEAIMRRHNRLLFRTARSILKSDADAEDVLQEGYLQAWRALASFRADAKLSTWLVRIVADQALARLRRRGAQVISLEAAMDVMAEPLFGNRELAKAAASILGDEAMHWAVLRQALGETPVPSAFVS
ncbi:MAG: sigma-70 family RNA polymerase sigma factor [Burkholderiaceae bacterium]